MNIYISGLSFSANDADLNNLFAEYGEVASAKVILDRETGKSRGFAFVEMTYDTENQIVDVVTKQSLCYDKQISGGFYEK